MVRRLSVLAISIALALLSAGVQGQGKTRSVAGEPASPGQRLADLIEHTLTIQTPTRSAGEYARAAEGYRAILVRLGEIERSALGLEDQVDYDLLVAHARTRIFEIETLRYHQVDPGSYLALGRTSALFLRSGALPDAAIRQATLEMRNLSKVLANARLNLTVPARQWTENAIYQAYYAQTLLRRYVPTASVDDSVVRTDFLGAAEEAYTAVIEYQAWLETDLLPRSTRAPTWKPEEIDFLQTVHEQLPEYGVDAMLRIGEEEERTLLEDMRTLAKRIHPSGDLHKVWKIMKEEAPPWEEVLPMARRYVEMTTA